VDTSVLIVGGSLNGLSTALFLAHRGVRCLVVERHPQTSVQYKFRGISPRSMEIYRGVGVEDDIRAHRTGDQKSAEIARTKNLAAPTVTWQGRPWAEVSDITPTSAATCDQDRLEPVLRSHAERQGAEVRFSTELVDFEQNSCGICARIRDLATHQEEIVDASYLVAADGADGATREALGIHRHGPGPLQCWMNVIFDTEMKPVLDGQRFTAVFVEDINGTFVPRESGRWLMAVPYAPERGERAEDFTDERCLELIRKGAGAEVEARVVDARPWEAAGYVAERYCEHRAFLVGDTAHVMPPTGGFGGNTGIQDAHNLAWKLDHVLRGAAGPELLDTYDCERRPVAEATLAQALARLQAWFRDPSDKLPPAEKIVDDDAVIFGHRYLSGALVAEPDSSAEVFEDPRAASGRPGSRAPHVVVERDGERLSILDLCAGRWVLLAGPGGGAWLEAAERIPVAADFRLQRYRFGPDGDLHDLEDRWSPAYGVPADGVVLIRPDGFIAWRARTGEKPESVLGKPESVLGNVLEHLSFRDSRAQALTARA
jgi:putative polyketide hydroxylase